MRKKAQGLSITFIIVAVLGLLVLIIVGVIFSGGAKKFSTGLQDCRAKQGTCTTKEKPNCESGQTEIFNAVCAGTDNHENPKCCVTVFTT